MPKTIRDERTLADETDAFEEEAGITDLLTAYDQAEVAYSRVVQAEATRISYSISSQPMTTPQAPTA